MIDMLWVAIQVLFSSAYQCGMRYWNETRTTAITVPPPVAKPIYTDAGFASNQEDRARKLVVIALWVIGVMAVGWSIANAVASHELNIAVAFDGAVAAVVFTLLFLQNRLGLRVLAHAVWWLAMAFIWFVQLKVEGIVGEHMSSVHLWFIVATMGAFLILIRERRVVVSGYVLLALASFVVCEFGLLSSAGVFPADVTQRGLARGVTFVSVFCTLILLTRAWSVEVLDAEEKLILANDRMEELMSNMLPRSISERLRREGKTFADGMAECSVMFVDIAGFTKMSAGMPAEQLVRLLDDVFSRFDELTQLAGLEKIKTIGDSYMVAAGLPEPRPDHAQALVRLALRMRTEVQAFGLHIRCGINSGAVVAGVIGKKRFIYDIWGDTVNVASRMESEGLVDEIQVTQATADLIANEFELHARGEIAIKGKGAMAAFLVVGTKA